MPKTSPQKFIQASYDRNNEWGLSKVKKYLTEHGYLIHEKDEDFQIDLIAEKDGKIRLFEVEAKTGYPFTCEKDFKFKTVSFLGRKKKWADLDFWYIIICRETLAFLICKSSIIYQEEYKEILTIDSYERAGEDCFYRVPKEKCFWYTLA